MEDINGFMAGVHGLYSNIVDYLRSKFSSINVLIPTYAMSSRLMTIKRN